MKRLHTWLLILASVPSLTFSQSTPDPKMQLIKQPQGFELKVIPSVTSSENDFDFLQGRWKVSNKKLKTRLQSNNEWDEFESILQMKKALGGKGNVENYYATFDDNLLKVWRSDCLILKLDF